MSDEHNHNNGENEEEDFFGGEQSGPVKSVEINSEPTLTLAALESRTGISYVTLQRLAQQYGNRIPHIGTGRNRRYLPAAIEVFKTIREERAAGRGKNHAAPVQAQVAPQKTRRRGNNPERVRKPAAVKTAKSEPKKKAAVGRYPSGRSFAEVSASQHDRQSTTAPVLSAPAVSKLDNTQRAQLSTLMEQLLDLNKRVAETEAAIALILS